MPSIKEIKRRIASVSSTKQILKAMDMVASAKLQKAKARLDTLQPFYKETERILIKLRSDPLTAENHFMKPRPVNNVAYIVITSNRGLCGGYNINVARKARSHMRRHADGKEKIIAVGAKGWEYFMQRGKKILYRYADASETAFFDDAVEIGRLLIELYTADEIDEAYVAYTQFESALIHTPRVIKLLPVNHSDADASENIDIHHDPNVDEILGRAIPLYLYTFIYGAIVESSVCEQAARMVSMGAATNNAADIIEDLGRTYNRLRQSAITQELSEIINGANMLNER